MQDIFELLHGQKTFLFDALILTLARMAATCSSVAVSPICSR